jgi:hypothetical protein
VRCFLNESTGELHVVLADDDVFTTVVDERSGAVYVVELNGEAVWGREVRCS